MNPISREERPTEQAVKVGQTFMSCLYDASIRKSLGGLGGCQEFDLNEFPAEFHDLILAYINEELCSVEAVFIAMRRAEAEVVGRTTPGYTNQWGPNGPTPATYELIASDPKTADCPSHDEEPK